MRGQRAIGRPFATHAAPRLLSVTAGLLLIVCGCGNDSASEPTAQSAPASDPAAQSSPGETKEDSHTSIAETDGPKSKTKWVGEIPYDVFYDQPLTVASENTSLAPAAVVSTASDPKTINSSTPETAPGEPTASSLSSAGGPDWQQLAAVDVLNEEVQRLRNALTANLNTLATYNRNVESIINDGISLAALAAVIEHHPDRVSWTDDAKFVRDLGYEITMNAGASGRQAYDATRLPFEQIIGILNGGPPPDREVTDNVPFAEVAGRSELMKRIKKSFDYLKAEVNTAERFQELPEDIVRESSVLATFGGIIATSSYSSTDEEQYRKFVTDFIQANVEMTAATTAGDFTKFEQARDRVQNACNACHAEYAFGDEGF